MYSFLYFLKIEDVRIDIAWQLWSIRKKEENLH